MLSRKLIALPAIALASTSLATLAVTPHAAAATTTALTFTVRSDSYAGRTAVAKVAVNGRQVTALSTTTRWQTKVVNLGRTLKATDEVEIVYDNDAAGHVKTRYQDRNLHVRGIKVDGSVIPASKLRFDAGTGIAKATDGRGLTRAGQVLTTNGALRFIATGSRAVSGAVKTVSVQPAGLPKTRAVKAAPTATPTATATPTVTAAPTPTSSPTVIVTANGTIDPKATPETAALFNQLRQQMSGGLMFGHHQDLSLGATITDPWSLSMSDTKASTGKYPAVIGWDGTSLLGEDNLGVWGGTPEQSAPQIASAIVKADSLGMVNSISWHAPNFVTGGRAFDTNGDVVTHIMPGGDKNAEFTRYLDAFATVANGAKRTDGTMVPIIFRPWHENNGDWFWWGKATTQQKIDLWQYTVTYLRDAKGVHNFLYAYSPSGGFWGNATGYLSTYPGDAYVDILGFDSYDNSQMWDSTSLTGTMKDLAMVVGQADARKKVAAFTEFGPGPAFKQTGNPDKHWFTTFLNALKADPQARRMAYAMTWSNWQADTTYVPTADRAADLLPDFQAFAKDPFVVFAR